MSERVMPQSPTAEASILGIILFDPKEKIDICLESLTEDDFYTRSNMLIFRSMRQMRDAGTSIDVITLTEHLRENAILEQVGGAHYISTLTHAQFLSVNLDDYISSIKSKTKLRALISLGSEIVQKSGSCEDSSEITDLIDMKLLDLRDDKGRRGNVLQSASDKVLDMIEKRKNGGMVMGVETGIPTLDRVFGGLQRGQMYVLGARPSCGKTSMADQITMNLILKNHPVLFIGLEASSERILAKMACKAADVIYWDFIRNTLLPQHLDKVRSMIEMLRKKPLVLLRPPSLSASGIRSNILSYARQFDLQLIVLDFIQRVEIPKGQDERRAIGDASKAIANASVETGIPSLVLAQLNRTSENEARPKMRHLKETGQLEEDADNVMLLWAKSDEEKPKMQEVILSIEKNKDGASGFDQEMMFDRQRMRFLEKAKSYTREP